jgi:hypothetical protein
LILDVCGKKFLQHLKNNLMKKLAILSGTLLVSVIAFGQNTIPTPNNVGSIGIGTLSPAEKLHVVGTLKVDGQTGAGGIRVFQNMSNGIISHLYVGYSSGGTDRGFNFQLNSTGDAMTLWGYDYPNFTWNQKFMFTKDGKFAAGTGTPLDQVHVFAESGTGGITITNPSTSVRSAITLENTSSSKKYSLGTTGSADGMGSGNFVIKDVTGNADRLVVHSNGGVKIGGGAAAPKQKLDVLGSISILGGNQFLYDYIDGFFNWGHAYSGNLYFRSLNIQGNLTAGYKNVMTLMGEGRVGIGTASPTASLTVNGNCLIGDPTAISLPSGYKLYVQTGILTEKVKVAIYTTSDWADYVFEKNYKLNTIEDVSKYIGENKHLPGVPSAKELVEQGGVDLAKMDAKLMEKIEELTLYVIQLSEKNKELNERINKLEKSK